MKRKFLLSAILICIGILAFGIINTSAETYGESSNVAFNAVTGMDVLGSGEESGCSWILCEDGTLLISCREDMSSGYVDSYDYSGEGVAPWYSLREKIKYIVINDGIHFIGDYAFKDCINATYAIIADSVTSIWRGAFYDCCSLVSVKFPDNYENYVNGISSYCYDVVEEDVFHGCESLRCVVLPFGVENFGDHAFAQCYGLETLVIPNPLSNAYFPFGDHVLPPNLKTIYFGGTKQQWINALQGSDGNKITANIIYNYVPVENRVEIVNATATENSLKFISQISKNEYDEIATFGTAFIPLWLFETGATNTAIVQYDNSNYNIQNGQTFGANLSGIPEIFKDMAIVGKSFIKDTNGNYIWSDAKYASVSNTTLKNVE